MTRPDLDALAALLDKATPGPWEIREQHNQWLIGPEGWVVAYCGRITLSRAIDNAALIVAAVNALPALIARVRELEQWQHDMVEKAAAKSLDGYRELAARAAAAENERDEARAAALAMRERCAKECEKMVDAEYRTPKVDHNEQGWTQACAAAVRALEV